MSEIITLQVTIFGLVAVGFLVRKLEIVGAQGQKNLNDLVIYVILPCNIFKAFLSKSGDGLWDYLGVLLISIGIQAFCVIYGRVMFKKEPQGRNKCMRYATICSNSGFLGNPIAEGLYGPQGLMLASIYLIPQRIMMWSSGLSIFSGVKDRRQQVKKVVTHPCIIACALGIIFMLGGWGLPEGLMGIVSALGGCNTAMSMIVIGMILSKIDLHSLWDPAVLKFSIHRLVIIPALVWAVCRFLPIDNETLGICVILAAMPAGATTGILGEKYGMEPEFATKLVIVTTLLSLPTLCLWIFALA